MTLEELCDEHYIHILKFLYKRTRDFEQAKDLTQSTFLKVCKAWGSTNNEKKPTKQVLAWVYAIATNTHRDELRRAGLRSLHLDDTPLDELIETRVNQESESTIEVFETLRKLTREHQQILLFLAAGGKLADLQRVTHLKRTAASMRINRARAAFQQKYLQEVPS